MSKNLGWPEFLALAGDTARELGTRRGETWTRGDWHEKYDDWPATTLSGPDRARLLMQYNRDCPGKITVTALLPEGTWTQRKFAANVDPARGARAIAQAADARVLRAGYLDILPGKVAEKQKRDAVRAARDAAAASAAALFRVPAPEDGKLSLSRFLPQQGTADFGGHGGDVALNLRSVPVATALRMLAVLAEDTAGSCCRSYGPGHHPDLAAAGCLRESSDRGHDASRRRVTRLLAGHGVDAVQAGMLLDGAYRSGSRGCLLPGTGITAAYDRDHGEFTVKLPSRGPASPPQAPGQPARTCGPAGTRSDAAAGPMPEFPCPVRSSVPAADGAARPGTAQHGQQAPFRTRGRAQ